MPKDILKKANASLVDILKEILQSKTFNNE